MATLEEKSRSACGGGNIIVFTIPQQTTTTNVATVVASVLVPTTKAYFIEVIVNAYKSDRSSMNSGKVRAGFLRAAGNVSRDGAQNKQLVGGMSGATLDLVANTATQTADITISGIAATTILWDLEISVITQ